MRGWMKVSAKAEVDRVLPWPETPGSVDMGVGALGDAHNVAWEEEGTEREAAEAHMGHIDMGQPHCGTGEAAVAAGSNSRDMEPCIHKVLGLPAGMSGSDYTVSSGPYPAASPVGLPADGDRSSCRPGSVLQTNRVLSRLGSREALQCKIGSVMAVSGDSII